MKILLIDNKSHILLNVKNVLHSLGHSCDSFDDLLVARSHFNTDLYDVVIGNIVMPAMNESESDSTIRFVVPATKKILTSAQFIEAIEAMPRDCNSVVSMEDSLIFEQVNT